MEFIDRLLDHGASPADVDDGLTGFYRAAREGRPDALESFARRGFKVQFAGVDRLIAACATNDAAAARAIATAEPAMLRELVAMGGTLLSKFASNWNMEGVRLLLDLGVPVDATFRPGDGYFGTAPGSLAIHVAAWRAQPAIVKLLIERGSPVNVKDARGRTPLMLAVSACVDSHWTERRSPESVAALLAAGATTDGVPYPCGYDAVDELIAAR